MYKYILTVMIKEWNAIGTDLLIRRLGCSVFSLQRRVQCVWKKVEISAMTSTWFIHFKLSFHDINNRNSDDIFYVTDGGVLNKWRYIDG